jgi:hypothetical protein
MTSRRDVIRLLDGSTGHGDLYLEPERSGGRARDWITLADQGIAERSGMVAPDYLMPQQSPEREAFSWLLQ